MTPYVLRNGHMGDAQAKISDLFTEVHELERELASARASEIAMFCDLGELRLELEQERQDRKQADLDTIRALGERNDARAELAKLKATLADPGEVELAMIRGDIAIPDRVEFDGIRETKNQTETDMPEARPSNDSPDVHETDFVNTTTPCVCGFCDGTSCNHGT